MLVRVSKSGTLARIASSGISIISLYFEADIVFGKSPVLFPEISTCVILASSPIVTLTLSSSLGFCPTLARCAAKFLLEEIVLKSSTPIEA